MAYRSPSTSPSVFIDKLAEICEQYLSEGGTIYIIGDFNINCHQSNRTDTYKNRIVRLMNFYGLKLAINKFTRVTQTSKTMIDLFFTNNNTVSAEVSDDDVIADHKSITLKKQSTARQIGKKTVVDKSKYSKEALNRKIVARKAVHSTSRSEPVTGPVQSPNNSLDKNVDEFVSLLYDSMNELFGKKVVTGGLTRS